MTEWDTTPSDPVKDIEAAVEKIKQNDKDRQAGKFGTRFGDVVLDATQLKAIWKQNSDEWEKTTGHTLDSFMEHHDKHGTVSFAGYRVKVV